MGTVAQRNIRTLRFTEIRVQLQMKLKLTRLNHCHLTRVVGRLQLERNTTIQSIQSWKTRVKATCTSTHMVGCLERQRLRRWRNLRVETWAELYPVVAEGRQASDARSAADAAVAVGIAATDAAAGTDGGLIATSAQRSADPSSKSNQSAAKTIDAQSCILSYSTCSKLTPPAGLWYMMGCDRNMPPAAPAGA